MMYGAFPKKHTFLSTGILLRLFVACFHGPPKPGPIPSFISYLNHFIMITIRLRKFLMKYHIGAFMAATFMFVSCTKDRTVANLSSPQTQHGPSTAARLGNISDEDVFRGVMFLDGPVASYMPDLQDLNVTSFMTPAGAAAARNFQDFVIQNIRATNPQYFALFRNDATSGDFNIVRSRITDAAHKIYDATLVMTNATDQSMQSYAQSVAADFKQQYNLMPQSPKSDVVSVMQQTAAAQKNTVYKYKWFFVYIAVSVALVLEFVGVIAVPAMASDNYFTDDFAASVTVNLRGI